MNRLTFRLTALFSAGVWLALAVWLCSCQSTETITTTTAPDGSVTQTVTRPLSDPFDIALSEAARELFKEGAE